jgi:hypothetical protein
MKKNLLAAIAASLLLAGTADAQERPCPPRPDALVLAILSVHEAGWEAEADMRGIHAALRHIAERTGSRYATAGCIHSGRALRGETSRSWVAGLDVRGSRPSSWPSVVLTHRRDGTVDVEPHGRWGSFRGRWLATLELARRVVLEEPSGTCLPETWGSDADLLARARRSSRTWVEVDCGETRNHFGAWATPPEEPAEAESHTSLRAYARPRPWFVYRGPITIVRRRDLEG